MELEITNDVRDAMLKHMLEEEQSHETAHECCGLLTLANEYIRCENIHDQPYLNFKMNAADSFKLQTDKTVVAYFHSHPGGLMCPSYDDMAYQGQIKKPSIIAARHPITKHVEIFQFGDHILDMPLEGMPFRLSVYDCWEQIRRYAFQKGLGKHESVLLPNRPRKPWFWLEDKETNEDFYSKYFKDYGFEEFNPDNIDPEPGDCILYQTDGAPVINHAAVYVGNNCIQHHRIDHKSTTSPITYFQSAGYTRKWLRYAA